MSEIELKYGDTSIGISIDGSRFDVLRAPDDPAPLSDVKLNAKLDSPIDSDLLEDIVTSGDTVLFVVPDATRRTAAGQVVNLLVRRLIANGTAPHEMAAIFATGIHRPVTAAEKQEILTPFIAQRIKTLDHNPRDLMQIVRLGETKGGIPIELNRALTDFDHVVLVGGVTFHYFAGFTGGRKLICPGLGSAKTISATHKLAFDCEKMNRRDGVGTALLDGNAVHEAFVEAASVIKPSFTISTIVDERGNAVDLFCGDWITSHRAACEEYARRNTINIAETRDVVIASCGGSPYDVNLIQAHKALEAAAHACTDGGTIILLAECIEGTGRDDLLDWFSAGNSERMAERLCERYQVNGQTAWSLRRKAERFDVALVTSMSDETVSRIGCRKIEAAEIASYLNGSRTGYIVPAGARLRVVRTI